MILRLLQNSSLAAVVDAFFVYLPVWDYSEMDDVRALAHILRVTTQALSSLYCLGRSDKEI